MEKLSIVENGLVCNYLTLETLTLNMKPKKRHRTDTSGTEIRLSDTKEN